jgi:membrane peptidoglycan carboxypeptidase
MARTPNDYGYSAHRRRVRRLTKSNGHSAIRVSNEGGAHGKLLLKLVIVLGTLAVLGIAIGGGAAVIVYNSYADDLIAPDELAINRPSYGAKIYDRNGTLLYEYVDDKSGLRRPIKLENISPAFLAATISTEDDSFFTNPGVNIEGLARAAWENSPLSGTEVFKGSGGSSITQQLVKNVYIPEAARQQRQISRKIKETVLAIELTNRYPKSQILEWYVNQISYGGVYNGVEAASQGYFGKAAKDITLAEAALLAGIPQSPEAYDPVNHPEAAMERRNDILDLLLRKGRIQIGEDLYYEVDAAEVEVARQAPVQIAEKRFPIEAPHFVLQYVQPQLEQLFGTQALFTDGLVVTTSLDLGMQYQTQEIMERWISEFAAVSNSHNGAMMVLDPKSGEVLVMVGSRDYFNEDIQGKNNNATACNSPGSAFKPFAYLTAFINLGWGPGTTILDAPVTFQDGGRPFTPSNPNKNFVGQVSIRNALGSSLNIPANKAAAAVGPDRIVEQARKMGFLYTFGSCNVAAGYGPAIATGGIDTTLEDMMVGYSTLANLGILRGAETFDPDRRSTSRQVDPISILKVTDAHNQVVYDVEAKRAEVRAAPSAESWMIADILKDPSAQCMTFGCGGISIRGGQAGVKTGTSEPYDPQSANAGKIGETWAFAYSPDLVVGMWAGNADNSPIVNILSTSISFRSVRDVMQAAYQFPYISSTSFARPTDLVEATICLPSGKKATPACGRAVTDLFPSGSVPTEEDTWWQPVKIDTRNGMLANATTPPQFVEEKVMLVLPPEMIDTEEERKALTDQGYPLAPAAQSDGSAQPGTEPGQTEPGEAEPGEGSGTQAAAAITSPGAGANVPADVVVGVTGTATSPNFESFTVQVGLGANPSTFTTIQQSNRPVASGGLASFSTAGLNPGPYTLRLIVTDKDGTQTAATVLITVGGVTNTPPPPAAP